MIDKKLIEQIIDELDGGSLLDMDAYNEFEDEIDEEIQKILNNYFHKEVINK